MANQNDVDNFDDVYQIEQTDPVLGGLGGVANKPLLNLANRTRYLYNRIQTILTTFATLASPAFSGSPQTPTQAADNNTTLIASTGFVLGQASAVAPLMDGSAAVGTATRFARSDHVHPTDTNAGCVVGSGRNVKMSVTATSSSASLSADELIVSTALGGRTFRLSSLNLSINLATVGVNAGIGGMDTGTAPTSGYVALYAIYNPTTQTVALLAQAEGAGAATSIYSGANMPAGYTASALVSVWATNASKLFTVGYQRDRHINILPVNGFVNVTGSLTPVSFSIAGVVPKSAIRYWANLTMSVGSGTTSCSLYTMATAQGAGIGPVAGVNNPNQNASGGSSPTDILTPQTSYYIFGGVSVQTPATNSLGINGYDF